MPVAGFTHPRHMSSGALKRTLLAVLPSSFSTILKTDRFPAFVSTSLLPYFFRRRPIGQYAQCGFKPAASSSSLADIGLVVDSRIDSIFSVSLMMIYSLYLLGWF
jgi:hypothetical protein